MIEGLKVTISGVKLKGIIAKSAKDFDDKANRLLEMIAVAGAQNNENLNSNAAGMRDRVSDHKQRSDELAFIADNINEGETYILDNDDLSNIGIVRRHW